MNGVGRMRAKGEQWPSTTHILYKSSLKSPDPMIVAKVPLPTSRADPHVMQLITIFRIRCRSLAPPRHRATGPQPPRLVIV